MYPIPIVQEMIPQQVPTEPPIKQTTAPVVGRKGRNKVVPSEESEDTTIDNSEEPTPEGKKKVFEVDID